MPDTTVMKNSKVGDEWIKQACAANPVQRIYDAAGQDTGMLLTGPVRLSWCDSIFTAKPQMQNNPDSKLKHSTGILFTPYTDMQLFWDEYYRIAAADFPEFWNPDMNQYVGIDSPFSDQGLKSHKYDGYTAGLWTTTVSSDFKPPVTDTRGNPIVDPARVYPGVWAIVAVSSYASGKKFPKKGPRFGLQGIVIIGDDVQLGGGAPDPKLLFGKVAVQAPTAVPSSAFSAAPRPNGPPGAPQLSPAVPASAHLPPTALAPRPPAAPPAGSGEDDYSQFGA